MNPPQMEPGVLLLAEERSDLTSETTFSDMEGRQTLTDHSVVTLSSDTRDEDHQSIDLFDPEPISVWNMRRGEKAVLFLCLVGWLVLQQNATMLSAFWPAKASQNAHLSEYSLGLAQAAFPLAILLATPLAVAIVRAIGGRWTLMLGLFIEGGIILSFSFTEHLGTWFVVGN